MYLSVGVVIAIVLVLASPLIWVGWWLLADLGEKVNGSYGSNHATVTAAPRRRAA